MTDEHCTGVQPIAVTIPAGSMCVCGKVLEKELRLRLGRHVSKGRGRWRLAFKHGKIHRYHVQLTGAETEEQRQDYIKQNYVLACSMECSREVRKESFALVKLLENME